MVSGKFVLIGERMWVTNHWHKDGEFFMGEYPPVVSFQGAYLFKGETEKANRGAPLGWSGMLKTVFNVNDNQPPIPGEH